MSEERAQAPVEPEEEELEPPRKRGGGVSLAMTLLGLALVGYLLLDFKDEAAFWMGNPQVVDLGAAGAYRLDAARHNALAKIAGSAGAASARYERLGSHWELVAIKGTNVVVRRPQQGAAAAEGQHVAAHGRLVMDTSAPQYQQAFAHLVEKGGAQPVDGHLYLLLDGDLPRSGWRMPALLALFAAFLGFNAWSLVRYFVRLFRDD